MNYLDLFFLAILALFAGIGIATILDRYRNNFIFILKPLQTYQAKRKLEKEKQENLQREENKHWAFRQVFGW